MKLFYPKDWTWILRSNEEVRPLKSRVWGGDTLSGLEVTMAKFSAPTLLIFKEFLNKDLIKMALAKTLDVLPVLAARLEFSKDNILQLSKTLSGALLVTYDVTTVKGAPCIEDFFDKASLFEKTLFFQQGFVSEHLRFGMSYLMHSPLLCLQLSYFDTGECFLGINISHAVSDARTLAIFMKTLNYFCSNPNQIPSLPELIFPAT